MIKVACIVVGASMAFSTILIFSLCVISSRISVKEDEEALLKRKDDAEWQN